MRLQVLIGALAGVGLIWTGLSAQQETRTTPGFGSGIVKVVGTVDIGNVPEVLAGQRGEWRVAVANTAAVRVANTPTVLVGNPEFVKTGAQYLIVWVTGEREQVTVTATATGGWIEVDQPGSLRRWINLSSARSIEEVARK
jgi:hypothetical protein